MDNMDIDQPTGSSVKRSSRSDTSSTGSTSSEKRARFILPKNQLTMLNNNMARYSREQVWQYRMQMAGDDDSLWPPILSDVLRHITHELARTDMQDRIITVGLDRVTDANGIVEASSKDHLEQWKAGVRNGVENGDWSDVIEHRAYDYQIVRSRLIVTTARLQNSNVPCSPARQKLMFDPESHRK
jgi:hypothetical protein